MSFCAVDVIADLAAFGCADRHAGRIAQRVLKRGRALRLQHGLVNDRDRLRDVA
jgi:hypothetical protein